MNENKCDQTVSLWARVGMSITVTESALTRLQDGDKALLEAILLGKSSEGTSVPSGETYFPDSIPENGPLIELDFTI